MKEKLRLIKSKIKNSIYFIRKENIILQKSIELNEKGFFYNINDIKNNEKISIIFSNNIPENTLITIISGKVEFKKNYDEEK